MRLSGFAPLFMLGVVLSGCRGQNLTRGKALDLLKRNNEMSAMVAVNVPVGNAWLPGGNLDVDHAYPLKALQDGGIIAVTKSGQKEGYYDEEWIITLTPNGADRAKSWKTTQGNMPGAGNSPLYPAPMGRNCYTIVHHPEECHKPTGVVYSLVLAKRTLKEITGIVKTADPNIVGAEFNWEWTPTSDAAILPGRVTLGKQAGNAAFQLYDDGWRITKIAFE